MSDVKRAHNDHPVHALIVERWSPYVFDSRPVSGEDLLSMFEAARWAASSYNEQPWRFIVATREDDETYQRALSCLVEANQKWAQQAPVLVITAVRTAFARNEKPNRVAQHDLGLALGNFCIEATSRGICVHQMAGVDTDRAREVFEIPAEFEAVTAFVVGYAGAPDQSPDFGDADRKPRTRQPLKELLFGAKWGRPAPLVD